MTKQIVDIETFYSGEEWTLAAFEKLLAGWKAATPESVRHTIMLEFSGGGYDESGKFHVYRIETDSEAADREARERARDQRYREEADAKERAAYERLKAKFG